MNTFGYGNEIRAREIKARDKIVKVFQQDQYVTDPATGEILEESHTMTNKVSAEPNFIKLYYETMLAFNEIHGIPVEFVLSLSKHIEWTNDGEPMYTTLNRRVKEDLMKDCGVKMAQVDRYVRKAVEFGLLFRTDYRAVYEVNPFMIAKGKWESIKQLQTHFDFVNGKWTRIKKEDTMSAQEKNVSVG